MTVEEREGGRSMVKTFEAIIDEQGQIRLLEAVRLPARRRALVTVLNEEPVQVSETALLSEEALADWNRPEEDAAWSHLQSGPWS
jgi:hypothetical protein